MKIDAHQSAAPAPDPAIPLRLRSRLYLVGEAERSTPARTTPAGRTSIQVNGQWHALRGRTATFSQLLRLAFPDRPLTAQDAATVSFRGGGIPWGGVMRPGDVLTLVDGLTVNADATFAS